MKENGNCSVAFSVPGAHPRHLIPALFPGDKLHLGSSELIPGPGPANPGLPLNPRLYPPSLSPVLSEIPCQRDICLLPPQISLFGAISSPVPVTCQCFPIQPHPSHVSIFFHSALCQSHFSIFPSSSMPLTFQCFLIQTHLSQYLNIFPSSSIPVTFQYFPI